MEKGKRRQQRRNRFQRLLAQEEMFIFSSGPNYFLSLFKPRIGFSFEFMVKLYTSQVKLLNKMIIQ